MTLPHGMMTFLFTDIEGSTKLWEERPDEMKSALGRHDEILRRAIESRQGVVFRATGDGFCGVFAAAPAALLAALTAQLALSRNVLESGIPLYTRMALHTGAAELRESDYFGQPITRVTRLVSAAHGGQILLSETVQALVRDTLPPPASLLNLGEHYLQDFACPEVLYQLQHPDLPARFPPLKTPIRLKSPHNLPVQATSFIGREREIAQIEDLFQYTSLLTLTGPGGAGKSRLSLRVAADLIAAYPDGVWLVELAPLTDPSLVPQTVAQALGVREQPGRSYLPALTGHLKTKQALLVLDNCEHLVAACARFGASLLHACPNVKILASSREPLGIAGEQIFHVPPLSLPDPQRTVTVNSLEQYEAARLFVDRALQSNAHFQLTEATVRPLVSLCHRLDGLPLAIELAAARVRTLTVEEIVTKLPERFDLLVDEGRAALPHQQTLRALIDWSYDLLTEAERTLLQRLSIFAGGWSLEAAEQVCADYEEDGGQIEAWEICDLLTSLADKSLLMAEQRENGTRFRLLDTVRQYAADRLSESGAAEVVRGRHLSFFRRLAEATMPHDHTIPEMKWKSLLETEHDNLRAALDYALSQPETVPDAVHMAGVLFPFWMAAGYLREGRQRMLDVLAASEVSGRTSERALALAGTASLSSYMGDYAGARRLHAEELAIRRELGDPTGIIHALFNNGDFLNFVGDLDSARAHLEECLALSRALGKNVDDVRTNLGITLALQGQSIEAKEILTDALDVVRQTQNASECAKVTWFLTRIALAERDLPTAAAYIRENVAWSQKTGDVRYLFSSVYGAARLAHARGDHARAVGLYAAQEAQRERVGMPLRPVFQAEYTEALAALRKALDSEAFACAWEIGQSMNLDQALLYAAEGDET